MTEEAESLPAWLYETKNGHPVALSLYRPLPGEYRNGDRVIRKGRFFPDESKTEDPQSKLAHKLASLYPSDAPLSQYREDAEQLLSLMDEDSDG